MKQNIGIDVAVPSAKCTDRNCPFHGEVRVRGRQFVGKVISDKMTKTVTVQWERRKYWPKYERTEMLLSSVKAHNPACINAKTNQVVRIMETRPLSKTKNFTVVQVLGEHQVVAGEDMTAKKIEDKKGKEAKDSKKEIKEVKKVKKSEE